MACRYRMDNKQGHDTKARTGNCWSLGLGFRSTWCWLVQTVQPSWPNEFSSPSQTNLTISYDFYPFSCLHMFRVFVNSWLFSMSFFQKFWKSLWKIRVAWQLLRQRHSLCNSEMKSKRRSELLLHLSPVAVRRMLSKHPADWWSQVGLLASSSSYC